MLTAASEALPKLIPEADRKLGKVYPPLKDIRCVTHTAVVGLPFSTLESQAWCGHHPGRPGQVWGFTACCKASLSGEPMHGNVAPHDLRRHQQWSVIGTGLTWRKSANILLVALKRSGFLHPVSACSPAWSTMFIP